MTTTAKLAAIKSQIEALVKKETGAEIEWTINGIGFTVNGKPEDVEAAKACFAANKLNSVEYDEELNESFAYYQ